jgi:glutamine amidotransferase-like uncharacterized protein
MSVSYRLFITIICILILPACNTGQAPILLFNGSGASPNDVAAVANILDNNQLNYTTVNSSELNAMSPAQLKKYRLFIVPGGDFMEMGNSLNKTTAITIRQAVKQGLNYFGICAGAFLAGNSKYGSGFNLTSGVTFGFYSAANKGVRKTPVAITGADGTTLEQYWEDGPQLTGWGNVVAKYPDGTPAVSEAKYGNGLVVLTGIHAEAPESWRRGLVFNTTARRDNTYAAMLIKAALYGVPIAYY